MQSNVDLMDAIEFDIGLVLIELEGTVGPWVEVCALLSPASFHSPKLE